MALRTPSLQNDNVVAIDREIGSQYDNVKTVAENIESVVTVADHIDNVDTVVTNIVDVHAVGGSIVDVRTVAANIDNVVTVVQDIANINVVAANVGNIDMIVTEVLPNINEIANASANAAIATTKANEAATSAANALVSEQNAKASELAAGVSEDNAAASEAVAIAKAAEADASAVAAHNSELAAEALLDAFNDRYLGSFAVDPTTDNDGQPLLDGALYYNTISNVLKVYDVSNTMWYTIPQVQLSTLLDVQLSSVTTGDVLTWNGSKWINTSSVQEHITDMNNPHSVTKAQVGLSNVDNTADNVKNVATATKWATARIITLNGDVAGSVSVDGSANVTITTTVQPNSIALGTDTTGNYMVNVTAGSGISVSHTQGEGSTATITNSAPNVTTNITTAHSATNVIVNSSDGTDGTINSATQTLAGVMSAADKTKLDGIEAGATGDQTASEILTLLKTVDGSGSGVDADLLDGQEGAYYLNASNINTGTINDSRLPDTITSDITGNAATATKLATARTISLTGDVSGSVPFDGSANVDIAVTVANDSHSHAFSNVTSKPTTVSGYGITDVYTKTEADSILSLQAPLASPALTGVPTGPTAAVGTSTTQLATTAFVTAEIANDTFSKAELTSTIGNIGSPLLHMPLKNSIDYEIGEGTTTFTRASTATYIDRYGVLKTAAIDEPRFEKEGYLNEGTSTNLLTYSEQFTGWGFNACSQASDGTTYNPYGVLGFSKFTASGSTAWFSATTGTLTQPTPTVPITISFFIKEGTITRIRLRVTESGVFQNDVVINIADGTEVKNALTFNVSIEYLANGIKRIKATYTPTITHTAFGFRFYIFNDSGDSTAGDYMWFSGAQLEALPFATSYIPTTSATVTRSTDNLKVDSTNNIGLPINHRTALVNFSCFGYMSYNTVFYYGTNNDFRLYVDSSNRFAYRVSGVGAAAGIAVGGTKNRVALVDASTTAKLYINGSLASTYTPITPFSSVSDTKIGIGISTTNAYPLYGHISNLRIYDKELSAQEVALA